MQCPRCQHGNSSRAKFCEECATPLARTCMNCGAQLSPTAKFCPECARPIDSGAAQPRFASPQSYTPKHLVEKILTSKVALEGERKQVTVLFADLKDSMELLADRGDPEEARQILDPVLERMMEAVHRYEGTVNQVMGDGIMALFGAPVAHEDHALRAAYAALAMQAAIRRYSEGLARDQAPRQVAIRVGLNSGEVVVRSIGSDLHMDYTAVGQTSHLAGRMEQLATPGTILLTGATLRLVEGLVDVTALGPITVKGLPTPVEVFELVGTRPRRSRLQAAAARGLTRFVGRDVELAHLNQALEHAGHGQGQVVALVGEAGVGKSRLLWEFTHSDRCRNWLVLESRSVSYGKMTSYMPVIELLKAYFQIEDRDEPRKVAEKVSGKVLALDEAFEPSLPAFLTLLDVPVDDPPWEGLDPRQRRQRTLEAVRRLLLRESQIHPVLLMFEDLHWIDAETQALLDGLVASLPQARLLLLVSYRPGYRHKWSSKTYYTQLHIDQLPEERALELLELIIGSDPGLLPLRELLIRQTDGNPFFIEESVRQLVETRVLVGERGAYRLARAFRAIQVPPTVTAILAARIDRLPPEAKSLLETAAVIGKDVSLVLLEAIAELSPESLRQALARLQRAEFLYETMLFPEVEYTFKHALTHEVAYGGLLHERRRALHAQILVRMERLYAGRLAEQVERLATHALRGELWPKAVSYLRQAGLKAMTRSANAEAVARLEQALEAVAHLPESHQTTELAIDLRFDLRNALFALGDLPRIEQRLAEAGHLATRLGDKRRLGWVSAYMSHYLWRVGDLGRAIESGEHALAVAAELDDLALETTNFLVGLAYYSVGDYPRAVECLRAIIRRLEGDQVHERFGWAGLPAVLSRAYLAGCLAEQGAFLEGICVAQEAVSIAEAADHHFSLGQALFNLGVLHVRLGELVRAVEILERCLDLNRLADVPAQLASTTSALGYAYALSGRVPEGIRLLEEGVAESVSRSIVARYSQWVAWSSEAQLLGGERDRAAALADRALALSRAHGMRGNEAYALRIRAEVASQQDPLHVDATVQLYGEALALAARLGMRPLEAQVRAGLGRLYRRAGRLAEARRELTAAASTFRELNMSRWASGVESELSDP